MQMVLEPKIIEFIVYKRQEQRVAYDWYKFNETMLESLTWFMQDRLSRKKIENYTILSCMVPTAYGSIMTTKMMMWLFL